VGDGQNRSAFHFFSDDAANELIRDDIDRSCGLVQEQEIDLTHNGPGQTQELPLPLADVLSTLGDGGVEPLR
jgi:hypothetical protein